MHTNEFLKVADILVSGCKESIEKVKLSLENPKEYVKMYRMQLSERGIRKHSDDLPLIALADTMIEKGLAWEIDWKEEANEVKKVIELILKKKNYHLDLDNYLEEKDYTGLETKDFLSVISEKLKRNNLILAHLDINSDSYVLIILLYEDFKQVLELPKDIINVIKLF